MSTLELADLLTQEVVENPLLEEIPTEDLQAADAQPATEKEAEAPKPETKNDTWDDADYEYFFGEYLDDSYKSARAAGSHASCRRSRTRSRPSTSLTDHLEWQLSLQTNDPTDPRDRRGHHRQPR